MQDVTAHILNGLREAITSKLFVFSSISVGAASVPVTNPQFIDLTAQGLGPLSYAGWIAVIGCIGVSTSILDKWGFFKLIKWIWDKRNFKRGDSNERLHNQDGQT